MSRWFNIADPCQEDIHYMLSPTKRLPDLEQLIQQRSYFVVHAPRLTGKTTAMLALAQQLTASERYTAVMVSAEVGSAFNNDPGAAELAILGAWRNTIENYLPSELHPTTWVYDIPGQRINENLRAWSRAIKRPLVLFIDEIDSLQDETLISVLRQLRDGFPNRPQNFPSSVGLIDLRDVRDYKVASGGSETVAVEGSPGISKLLNPKGDRLNTSSPFNIKVSSITFLHRVVNGGGTLEREYAIGSDRMDLCLRYGSTNLGIELKVWREKKRDPQVEGIEQLESSEGSVGIK